jgi:hypothetical protein
MDKWLAVLQKVTAPVTPQPVSKKTGPSVESAFRDLCKVSDDEDDAAVAGSIITTALYENDVPTASIHDPVSAVFEKAANGKFNIPTIAPPHEDGTFFEKCGSATWSYTYANGRLVKSACDDPELPCGHLEFDEHGNEVTKRALDFGTRSNRAVADHCLDFYLPNQGVPDSSTLREHLDLIDLAWEELLGRGGAFPERRQEVSADPKKKKVASAETYNVGGQILAKNEMTSKMYGVLAQLREFCVGQEYKLLDKAIKACDITCFAELAETILARSKRAA